MKAIKGKVVVAQCVPMRHMVIHDLTNLLCSSCRTRNVFLHGKLGHVIFTKMKPQFTVFLSVKYQQTRQNETKINKDTPRTVVAACGCSIAQGTNVTK
jgi:hypothetical protein